MCLRMCSVSSKEDDRRMQESVIILATDFLFYFWFFSFYSFKSTFKSTFKSGINVPKQSIHAKYEQ